MTIAQSQRTAARASYVWVLMLLFLLAGCIAAPRTVGRDELSRIHRLAVVPMESPPLEIDPRLAGQLSVVGSELVLAPGAFGAGGRILASVSGLLLLADLPRLVREAGVKADNLERMLKEDENWGPSLILARYLATQLSDSTPREVTMVNTPVAFPGVEHRERTAFMRNWWIPIRDGWYNADTSPLNYSQIPVQGVDAILEVAVAGYAVTVRSSVAIDVLIKLTDPVNGKALARTRQYTLSCGKMLHPFEDGAQELKRTITTCLQELGAKALKDIGFLPAASGSDLRNAATPDLAPAREAP